MSILLVSDYCFWRVFTSAEFAILFLVLLFSFCSFNRCYLTGSYLVSLIESRPVHPFSSSVPGEYPLNSHHIHTSPRM